MKNKLFDYSQLFVVALIAVLLVACGAFDTDVPASSPANEGDSQAAAEDEVRDEVQTFEIPETRPDGHVVDGGEGGKADDAGGYHRCVDVCFKSLWCNADGPDFAACIDNCKDAEESGLVYEDTLYCLEGADDCRDVAFCEATVEPCTEVCGVYDQCGYFHEGEGCHQWCSAEIWAGRLDWTAQGCVNSVGRNDACPDLAACGLAHDEH